MAKPKRAIRSARALIEAHSPTPPVDVRSIAQRYAHVIEQSMPDEVSGMLVPLDDSPEKPWAIIYNADHAEVRQRFTVAHELGHLRLHGFTAPHADRGFKVRFRASHSRDKNVYEEVEANTFAAELLMPIDHVLRAAVKLRLDYGDPDPKVLDKLAGLFNVSSLAMSIRIADLAYGPSM